jgi:molybdopterin converting factor small subunit
MKVKASFFGPIRRPWPEQSREVEVEDGTDVQALLESLGYQVEDLRRVAVVIRGKKVRLSHKLEDGDEVRFVLLAGGG